MDVYWFPKAGIARVIEVAENTIGIIQVVTMATMTGTTTSIINPKHQGLSVLPNGLRRVYGNCNRKNVCEAFAGAGFVKIIFPPASN